jgi:ABC-type Zn uptake system ZnuABC Zn-binding protein ZnuA
VEAAADARLVFANGDGLDGWIEQVVSDSGGDAAVVDLGAAVPVRLPGESGSATYDPHWWADPRNAAAAVRDIERRLAAADPAHRSLFAGNADAYLGRLRVLERRLASCFAAIPPRRRRLVTDHDAFGYFAHRYGIDVVGAAIPSQATEAQPSAKDLRELAQTVEAEGVSAIFPESSLSPKVADAIARQTGARFGEALYGDTLGPAGSSGSTYLRMEQANAEAMARGFTGGRRGCG